MRFLFSFLVLLPFLISAQSVGYQSLKSGEATVQSSFFRERYLQNDLVPYLDNASDFVTYQSETTGSFDMPDQLVFSIVGNSHRWNKYYLNGFRVDSRFASGSSNYRPDMYSTSMRTDYIHSTLRFSTDSVIPNSASLRYNVGGLGGINDFTETLVHLFHNTASERTFKDIKYRNKLKGAGSVSVDYALNTDGRKYSQSLSFNWGTRQLVDFDQTGISNYYPENFAKLQLLGELPLQVSGIFDHLHYLLNYQQRDNLYNEFYFSQSESAKQNSYSLSVYGTKNTFRSAYSSGFTLMTNKVRHQNLNYSRNLIDQDGEAFDPWYPDGATTELSHALNYTRKLRSGMNLTYDGYNSLIGFNPSSSSFHNTVYAENVNAVNVLLPYLSLYVYQWASNAYTAALLENTLGLNQSGQLARNLSYRVDLDVTLDGMLMSSKSVLRPNVQAQLSVDYDPYKWLDAQVNVSRNRVAFNLDDIRYLSNDYLNADIYYWNDADNDKLLDAAEQGGYFSSTGGKYHSMANNIQQQSYLVLDIPVKVKIGRSEYSVQGDLRKYMNSWTTRYENQAWTYGGYEVVDGQAVYYLKGGTPINYVLDYYPDSYMKSGGKVNWFTNSPYWTGATFKYQYTGEKLLFSFTWTSYLMAGVSSLGSGPLHNDLGVYSESSANPNVVGNYLLGRLDQDRAYTARILASYKFNPHLSVAMTGKFKDGQPFTSYDTKVLTINGEEQIAIWPHRSKGINPVTNDFGSRKDAFFNIDARLNYKGEWAKRGYELQLAGYNLIDFGTELTEYTFEPNPLNGKRRAMSLCIPRGLMVTAKVNL